MIKNIKNITIDYMINAPCNLKCPFCYGPNPSMKGELNMEGKLNLIKGLSSKGIERVVIAGGEPTLDKDLIPFCRQSKKLGIKLGMQTNAFYLGKLKECLPYLDWIALPLDGVSDYAQKIMRTSSKHFKNLVLAIKEVEQFNIGNSKKVKIKIGTVLSKYNVNELGDMAYILNGFNSINVWKLYKIRKRGKGNDFFEEAFIDDRVINEHIISIRSKYPKLEIYYSNDEESLDSYLIIDPNSSAYIITGNKTRVFGGLINVQNEFDSTLFNEMLDCMDVERNVENVKSSFPKWIN